MSVKMLTSIVLGSIVVISFNLTPSQERIGSVVDEAVAARQMGGQESYLYLDAGTTGYTGCVVGNSLTRRRWCSYTCGIRNRYKDLSGGQRVITAYCGDELTCAAGYPINPILCY